MDVYWLCIVRDRVGSLFVIESVIEFIECVIWDGGRVEEH